MSKTVVRTISKKTKYGLQSLIALARRHGEGPVLIATLAREEDIPIKFLELILLELKNHGFLESRKGPGGGYLLSRPPDTITLGSAIRFLEGPLAPLSCANEDGYHACEECRDLACCGIRMMMCDVRDAISGILDRTTLQDVLMRSDAVRSMNDVVCTYEI